MNSIAIIEPCPILRGAITELISAGYSHLFAKNGMEGLKLIRNNRPDVLLANTELEHLDGFQLVEMMRQDIQLSRIPVLLYSIEHELEEVIRALQSGANGFVRWPHEKDIMRFKVKNIIQWESNSRQSGSRKHLDKAGRFISKLNEVIEKNLDNVDLNMQQIADALDISASSLQKNLKKYRDKSVSQYVREYRLLRSRDLIEARSGTLSEVSVRSGFRNLSYFSKSFKLYFGYPPSSLS